MTCSRKRTIIAGLTLIVVVNFVALAGVAYNRSGESESALRLTQRELAMPYYWGSAKENNGLALNLQWRTPALADPSNQEQPYAWSNYGPPGWVDKAKMAALGFDTSALDDSNAGYNREREKDVFLVLELDGPAYRQALDRTRQYAAQQKELSLAHPENKEFIQRAKNGDEQLSREASENSRLFAVDAGLDVAQLRTQYPDRAHYAIVRGRVRPLLYPYDKQKQLMGTISGLSVTAINVPVDFRQGFQQSDRAAGFGTIGQPRHFEAEVAFGRRLEPWIRALSGKNRAE
jgi:hypothetical protein